VLLETALDVSLADTRVTLGMAVIHAAVMGGVRGLRGW
jgi:hypothetical protein